MNHTANIILTAVPYLAIGWLCSYFDEWSKPYKDMMDEEGFPGLLGTAGLGHLAVGIAMVLVIFIFTIVVLCLGASWIGLGFGVFGGIVLANSGIPVALGKK